MGAVGGEGWQRMVKTMMARWLRGEFGRGLWLEINGKRGLVGPWIGP